MEVIKKTKTKTKKTEQQFTVKGLHTLYMDQELYWTKGEREKYFRSVNFQDLLWLTIATVQYVQYVSRG